MFMPYRMNAFFREFWERSTALVFVPQDESRCRDTRGRILGEKKIKIKMFAFGNKIKNFIYSGYNRCKFYCV
jgi:hypothetical protein